MPLLWFVVLVGHCTRGFDNISFFSFPLSHLAVRCVDANSKNRHASFEERDLPDVRFYFLTCLNYFELMAGCTTRSLSLEVHQQQDAMDVSSCRLFFCLGSHFAWFVKPMAQTVIPIDGLRFRQAFGS